MVKNDNRISKEINRITFSEKKKVLSKYNYLGSGIKQNEISNLLFDSYLTEKQHELIVETIRNKF